MSYCLLQSTKAAKNAKWKCESEQGALSPCGER